MTEYRFNIGVLGATGAVGQRFLALLAKHPWFHVRSLMASGRSAGKPYRDACHWFLDIPAPFEYLDMPVKPCVPDSQLDFVFSGLDATAAETIESDFARAGIPVISNARTHRMESDVPLIIPEINRTHLPLILHQQKRWKSKGFIVTNPNCSTIVLALSLAPLVKRFGVKKVMVSTMQALSGAGYPGVSGLDILDNVIPEIPGEEAKMETEPLKIFGSIESGCIIPYKMSISARCHRVGVSDGHLLAISVKTRDTAGEKDILEAWSAFSPDPILTSLPSMPAESIVYLPESDRPQPKKDRFSGEGMTVTIGRLKKCNVLDFKFSALGHNTIRGAAGGAILLAELLAVESYL